MDAAPSNPGTGTDIVINQTPAKRAQVPRACPRCKSQRRACSDYRPCKRCIDAGLGEQCAAQDNIIGPGAPFRDHNNETSPFTASEKLRGLIHDPLVDYCSDRFFVFLHPTIPILSRDYLQWLRTTPSDDDQVICLLSALCALVLLQVEEQEDLFEGGVIPEKNGMYGRMLFEEACNVQCQLSKATGPSLQRCLIAFFLYACHARLFHHSKAFLSLREATSLFVLLRMDHESELAQSLAENLFWVLLISERSHAIRYRRSSTLQITADTPPLRIESGFSAGLSSLAALFRPIDTVFIALLNQEISAAMLSPAYLEQVESAVNNALRHSLDLQDSEKANLRVTQLWLQTVIWQLRLRLGGLVEESHQPSLTYRYPLIIAKNLVLSTHDLSVENIRIHGVGLTEKLFDVASAVIDVLARVPPASLEGELPSTGHALGIEEHFAHGRQLINLITALPGSEVYDQLLERHLEQAGLALRNG